MPLLGSCTEKGRIEVGEGSEPSSNNCKRELEVLLGWWSGGSAHRLTHVDTMQWCCEAGQQLGQQQLGQQPENCFAGWLLQI